MPEERPQAPEETRTARRKHTGERYIFTKDFRKRPSRTEEPILPEERPQAPEETRTARRITVKYQINPFCQRRYHRIQRKTHNFQRKTHNLPISRYGGTHFARGKAAGPRGKHTVPRGNTQARDTFLLRIFENGHQGRRNPFCQRKGRRPQRKHALLGG